MKLLPFYFTMFALLLIGGCGKKLQSTNCAFIDHLIVGKWEMVEYASGSVNALDALSFYKNGKADCPPETGKFTYQLIKPDSLIIYNKSFEKQHCKILKLSNDSLILIDDEIVKYIRVVHF